MIPCKFQPPRVPFGVHRGMPVKGSLAELNSADPFFYIKHHINGQKEVVFHVNIIDILDKVFLMDGMKFLSREQERFLSKFIEAAEAISTGAGVVENLNIDYYDDLGIIGEYYNSSNDSDNTSYTGIDPIFIKLDHFLGNYKGVDENEYTR